MDGNNEILTKNTKTIEDNNEILAVIIDKGKRG